MGELQWNLHQTSRSIVRYRIGTVRMDLTNIHLDIYLETKYENIRATIDHRSTTGFEICAFATTYMPYLSVRISWKASENVIMVCDTAEYRCQSGECIKRETICDAYRFMGFRLIPLTTKTFDAKLTSGHRNF